MPSPLNKTIRLTPEEALQPIRPYEPGMLDGIFVGDVMDLLPAIPDGKFDLIIADPPYNLGVDFGNNVDRRSDRAYRDWTRAWLELAIGKGTGNASFYIFCDWRYSGFFQEQLDDLGLTVMNRITWKREKGRGAKSNWKQNMEDIWFAVRDPKCYTFNIEAVRLRKAVIAPYRENGKPKDWIEDENGERVRFTHPSNIWIDFTVPFWSMPENTPHPTQKPEALIERILLASSNPGDRILDLFSGSGTTSVVARRLSRTPLGIELNPEYVRLANKRLELLQTSNAR